MKKAFRLIVMIVGIQFVMFWVIGIWQVVTEEDEWLPEEEEVYDDDPQECEEYVRETKGTSGGNERTIQRAWKAYYAESKYCGRYQMSESDRLDGERLRKKLNIRWDGDYVGFWGSLYSALVINDSDKLIRLADSLQQIARGRGLSRRDFAFMIVAFVQDIPYEFVLPEACTDQKGPCNGNVDYGIYSPAEFAYSLKGDCDTRTVLLYTILENLGFDAVIFNSYEYAHSMLGVNLPFAGDYLHYRGKNYYFWETTNVGWMPGQIPPDWGNTDYWTVVLD